MNRVDILYRAGEAVTSLLIRAYYSVYFDGKLPKAPYVLLPKHQSLVDIPIEGWTIYRQSYQYANFVMRPLPFNLLLEMLGGIPVARAKDLRKGKISKEQADERNENAKQRAIDCLKKGEPLVIHPEGTRHYKEMGAIRVKPHSIIDYVIKEQKNIGAMPFVPMGIEYKARSIYVRIGQPFYTDEPNELEVRAAREIARLSNLSPNNMGK